MKKILSAIFAATLCVSLAACGGTTAPSSSAASSTESASSAVSSEGSSDASSAASSEGSSAAAAGGAVEKIKAAGKLVMGTNAAFPPFEYIKDNVPAGVDVDIAAEVAKDLGVELVVEDMDFNGIIPALQSGKVDIGAAGMTITEERKKEVNFSNNYVKSAQYVIIVKGSGTTVDALKEKGAIIGVQEATTGDIFATDEIKADPNTEEVARYANAIVAAQDLINGKCSAVIIDEMPAKNIVAANPDKLELLGDPLTEEDYAIAIHKDNADLLEAVNATIKRLQDEGKIEEFLIAHTAG